MPSGGAAHRSGQMALLAGLYHERATDPRVSELLSVVEDSPLVTSIDSVAAVNVRELRRAFNRKIRLPKALVEELARTTSLAQHEWVAARSASDFSRFLPWLEQIVHLKRQEAACLTDSSVRSVGSIPSQTKAEWPHPSDVANGPPPAYDSLLDEYEPGANSSQLATLLQDLRHDLVPLVQAIREASQSKNKESAQVDVSSNRHGEAILKRFYPRERQRVFGETVAAAIGFDFNRGRLDVTAHPFCSGIGPGDCRITTRFDEHHFGDAFFGILHEVGHGLYEQGLDPGHYGTPMGEAVSLGMHESQSRLWENAVARGLRVLVVLVPDGTQYLSRGACRRDVGGIS